jgi:hypothetical protein
MDIRPIFLILGIILIIGSYWWGDFSIWLGAPMIFIAIIFQFLDKD